MKLNLKKKKKGILAHKKFQQYRIPSDGGITVCM